MNTRPTKGDKAEIRRETRLTRPPRFEQEGKATRKILKKKRPRASAAGARKPQGPNAQARSAYQLKGPHH